MECFRKDDRSAGKTQCWETPIQLRVPVRDCLKLSWANRGAPQRERPWANNCGFHAGSASSENLNGKAFKIENLN